MARVALSSPVILGERMEHVFEPAPSARARCRGCGRAIGRGELRFGERMPNPFAEGETTLWFHPLCAAYKRPEPVLAALAAATALGSEREGLEQAARASASQRRRARIDGAERAPSGQAKCRSCKAAIERGSWRIRLVFFEEGRFSPGGFVHLGCRRDYFESEDVLAPLLHFSPDLDPAERADLVRALAPPPDRA
jgi:hypothetical protein